MAQKSSPVHSGSQRRAGPAFAYVASITLRNKGRAKAQRPQLLTGAGYCQEIKLPLLLQKKTHCESTDLSEGQTCASTSGWTRKDTTSVGYPGGKLVLTHNSAERQREWLAFWFVLGWSELKGYERSFSQTCFTLSEKPRAHSSVPDSVRFVSAHTGRTD